MQRGLPLVIGQPGGDITQVDQQRTGLGQHIVPRPVRAQHLQPGDPVGPEHGDDAVVGVLAHPVELTVELHGHPWLQGVVDGAQHVDGVVGQGSDGAAGLAQGVLEDVDESLGHSLGSAEPRLQLRPEVGHPLGAGTGLGGPHVLRVVRGRQVEFREVGRLHTDVEGLEEVVHPGRGLHAQ